MSKVFQRLCRSHTPLRWLQSQAVQLMEVMSNTDAVLIAGGSGTIQEAITGLMRREDADRYAPTLPVGFLPLGTNNNTFKRIYENEFSNLNTSSKRLEEVKTLADSTMKVLNDKRINLNVLRIHTQDTQKTVFSFNKFEFGILTELERQFAKYWYLSDHLAKYYVYIKATLFRQLNQRELGNGQSLKLDYTDMCTGCSRCFGEFRSQELQNAKQRSSGWFSSMFRSTEQKRIDQFQLNIENQLKNRVNNECGRWKGVQVDRLMNVQIENQIKSDRPELRLKILRNSKDLSKIKFFAYMKTYPNQQAIAQEDNVNSLELSVKDLKFDISSLGVDTKKPEDTAESSPSSSTEDQQVKSDKLDYFIDDENYDVQNELELNSRYRKMLTFS